MLLGKVKMFSASGPMFRYNFFSMYRNVALITELIKTSGVAIILERMKYVTRA